jgi:tetratricopeptide (TPR) repeat protein
MTRTRILVALVFALGCAHQAHDYHADAGADATGHDHGHTQAPRRVIPEGAGAPLFSDLGSHRRPITTASELAQRYFDQGLVLTYGFNHAEALRSFREASAQDPACAMCAWGEAYVLGPNINKPMDDADVPAAYAAVQRAVSAAGATTPVERALIEALSTRYAEAPVADRAPLDAAYADAMRDVAHRFPDDVDVLTLFAEALMDTMPWDYYEDPDTPRPATQEVLEALEAVMASDPEHPGALHYYIHAVEPSSQPDRGEQAADRLGPLAPGAGHLVHMPSHIYLRVGRYHDASIANEKAASADESYITQCRAQGFYPAAYYPHNVHFLYAASAFEGRSEVSIAAARKLSANMTPEIVAEVPSVEEFVPMELYALARFGRWEELEAAPAPPQAWRYTTGVWHFGRGMSFAARGRSDEARAELAALEAVAAEPGLAEMYFASGSTPAQLLAIGARVLEARLLGESGRWVDAIALLRDAVEMQDALPYTEPPPFYFPTREALGHALLEANRPGEAEATFRKQLHHTPRNGWSLLGLAQSLEAQGDSSAGRQARAQLAEAWRNADISPPAAVF